MNNYFSSELSLAINASLVAGKKIMDIYNSESFDVEFKNDLSPLTNADKASHKIITEFLNSSNHPILSEEGKSVNFNHRKNWKTFWIIDPIDGTKEFINRNGEFTVNIGLISNNNPVLGVVYAPFLRELYYADKKFGSYKVTDIDSYNQLKNKKSTLLNNLSQPKVYTVIVSRSHSNSETKLYIENLKKKFPELKTISHGSSLKICKVADGTANCYPRFGPTMEWDTAAAHAVAKFAGCKFNNPVNNLELSYNKKNLINPFFIVKKNADK